MSGISTSVGPFSGINTGELINQLLSIESRPKTLAQFRLNGLQTQRAALLDVNSSLLALKTASGAVRTNKVFTAARATVSNESVLTARASAGAATGTYQVSVARLVSTQQQLSRGFVDRDTTGIGATQVTVEVGGGRLETDTSLAVLNGGLGVSRGKIKITDRAGASATIDLSTAVSVKEVLDAINANGVANVTASVSGDSIKLTDNTTVAGTFKVENVSGYTTADSLGIRTTQTVGAGDFSYTGARINALSNSTALASLNDGTGVALRNNATWGVADFRITTRSNVVIAIELGQRPAQTTPAIAEQTAATTLQQVVDRINNDSENLDTGLPEGRKVTASIDSTNNRLVLTDNTAGAVDFKVEEGDAAGTAAKDLGILAAITNPGGVINGRRLIAGLNSTLLSSLKGGDGAGTSVGAGTGEFTIMRRSGASALITVNANDSVADIIGAINAAGAGLSASLNASGNGIRILDASAASGTTTISDDTGSVAESLNLEGSTTTGSVESGNLQTRWVSGATRLADLNAKSGVGTGEINLIDSSGVAVKVTVDASIKTVDDFIRKVNSVSPRVKARLNDNGDGIVLYDNTGAGALKIKVEDVSGSVARRLNLLGTSASDVPANNKIDGSFERIVAFDATDTLDEITNKINAAAVGVQAAVITDGGSGLAYRLSLTSRSSGAIGNAIVDFTGADLALNTLTRGRDALAFFGSADPATAIALTGSTNTLDGAIQGVSIDLKQTSAAAVQVVVTRDTDAIETAVDGVVSAFNTIVEKLAKYDKYDAETKAKGALLGDSTVAVVRAGIFRVAQGTPLNVLGRYDRLTQVGINVGTGGKLTFDKTRFREAFQTDPAAVEELLSGFEQQTASNAVGPNGELLPGNVPGLPPTVTTGTPSGPPIYTKLGVFEVLKNLTDSLTNSVDGALTRRDRAIQSQIDVQNDRIRNFDLSLERKRARYERQFQAMERAIASLQTQKNALGSIGAVG